MTKWPENKLFTAFVGMLFREGWTFKQIDRALWHRRRKKPDAKHLRRRFAWFMAESQRKGLK